MRKTKRARRVQGARGLSSALEGTSSSESCSQSSYGDREFEKLRLTVIDDRGGIVGFFDGANCREVFLGVIHDNDSVKSLDLVWLEDQRWALVSHSWNYSDLPIPMARIIEPSKAAEYLLKRTEWQQQCQPFPRELEQHAIGVRQSVDDPAEDGERRLDHHQPSPISSALAYLVEHRGEKLSVIGIARAVGTHRSTLYRYDQFKAVWEVHQSEQLRRARRPPKGFKNSKTGELDAFE